MDPRVFVWASLQPLSSPRNLNKLFWLLCFSLRNCLLIMRLVTLLEVSEIEFMHGKELKKKNWDKLSVSSSLQLTGNIVHTLTSSWETLSNMKLHRWNRRYVTGSEEKNTFKLLQIRATSKWPQQCTSELWPLDISLEHHQAPQQSADNQIVSSHLVQRPALFLLFLYSVDQEDHVPPTQKPSLAQQTANKHSDQGTEWTARFIPAEHLWTPAAQLGSWTWVCN